MSASSRAASTSSRMQKGVGLTLNRLKIRAAAAVSARSPPESRERLVARLPGGRVIISMPVSATSSGSVSVKLSRAAAEKTGEISRKGLGNGHKRAAKLLVDQLIKFGDDLTQLGNSASSRSAVCCVRKS